MHVDLPCRTDLSPAAHQGHHEHHQGASARTHSCNSHYGTLQDLFWTNAEDPTLETTLFNISIDPASMDGPADGEIFESNHLGEIADIWSKLIQNLVKVGKTYCHLCAQLLNPNSEELLNFLVNHERTLAVVCTMSSTWMIYWQQMLDTISSLGTQCSTTQGTSQPL